MATGRAARLGLLTATEMAHAAVFRDWFEDVLGARALKPLACFDR